MGWATRVCLVGLTLLSLICSSLAVYLDATSPSKTSSLRARESKPFTLRIMPLGASITTGYKSSDENGYRISLRQQLRYAGWEVNMVGSLSSGTMHDNDNEGHSGYRIEQVAQMAERTIPQQPNLILINAGTNDATQPFHPDTAGERMNAMISRLFDAIPGTTIILSTLLPNEGAPENAASISAQIRQIAADRREQGQRIVLAEMSDFITLGELQDGTHPTDHGYFKMSSVWWAAIQVAEKEGMLQPPKDIGVDDKTSTTCEKKYGSGNGRGRVQTQRGSGYGDGDYVHSSQPMGYLTSVTTTGEGDAHPGLNYAQLVNKWGAHREGALDELVWTRDGLGTWMYINNNNGEFGAGVKIDVKDNCLARGVHWGDVNGDGNDDFICISREGAMYVSINEGGNPPTFRSIGLVRAAPGGDLNQANVRLGDIDGDGRIDYCLAKGNGDIQCWRNGGQKDAPTSEYQGYWQNLGTVFTGKGMGDLRGVRFVDINGDFRSDWVWVSDTGEVTTYINNRGTGKSLKPEWRAAGVTHPGMGKKGTRDRVKFGKVYAHGGADYVVIETKKDGKNYKHNTHAFKNTGHGGTQLKADGDHYCDMRGTGADDYVWISPEGRGFLYGNIHKPPVWVPEGIEIFNVNKDRKGLHLADFDGDGKCDLWSVNRDTGEAEVWLNKWSESVQNAFFTYQGKVTGSAKCTQGWGVGLYDLGLRFADIDGDGRADYLCMEPNGRTDGWLNKGAGKFESVGQVKHSEGYDRANHRWADVNGDGRADFLWVDKFNGDTTVWVNNGKIPTSGSSFNWKKLEGPRYQGSDRGANLHFPNLGGLGRADMHQVIPRTNVAYTWFNECPGGGALDDSNLDPKLVPYDPPEQPTPGGNPSIPTPAPEIPSNGLPQDYYKNWPLHDDDVSDDICGNLGYLEKSHWQEYDIGNWLVITSAWYQKLTLDNGNDFEWDRSVPVTFARYNGTDRESDAYIWDCSSADNTCTAQNLGDSDKCKDTRFYRVAVLYAAQNLARYIEIVKSRMNTAWGKMNFKSGKMIETYSKAGKEDNIFPDTSALTVAAAIAGGLSVFMIPQFWGVAGGALGVSSQVVAFLQMSDPETKFNTYAEMTDKAADIYGASEDAVNTLFNNLFTKTPPRDANWINAPNTLSLPRFLQTGDFVDSRSVESDNPLVPSADSLVPLIAAPMIKLLWEEQKVWILKLGNDFLRSERKGGYHPCDGAGEMEEVHDKYTDFTENKFCNPDGTAFFVFSGTTTTPYGLDKLKEEYGFTGHDIAKSSELLQNHYGKYRPEISSDDYFSWVPPTNSGGDVALWELMRWNFPVCDTTKLEPRDAWECDTSWQEFGLCFTGYLVRRCLGIEDWPNDYTEWDESVFG
ncbi:hypothetical protein BDV25DRAFT_144353 [Aspergillus avenaceus]|uniref:SGNH hydrolase-type esterase domain-containing protein n=1 Tax=Aspergillus avenaceus TaxID=36643 RepID=A0A5N6THY7_ASPAV|nr:hypothetical protein BDV25DRAFT_144353 [Aspergillus avenaceus]